MRNNYVKIKKFFIVQYPKLLIQINVQVAYLVVLIIKHHLLEYGTVSVLLRTWWELGFHYQVHNIFRSLLFSSEPIWELYPELWQQGLKPKPLHSPNAWTSR
jgi:hypothetical protein